MQASGMGAQGSIGRKQPYLFVNTVRFWSMFAVVAVHCLAAFGMLGDPMAGVRLVLDTPVKFGTIDFFLISGFLLGDKLKTCRAGEYLRRRLKRVFVPWMVWYLMLVAYFMVVAHHDAHTAFHWSLAELKTGGQALFDALFLSPLWFVPNLMLGICVLLMFRRYLYSVGLGLGLFAFTGFYAVNIYFEWVPSLHPEALTAFVFYLWLGSYVSHNRERFVAWLGRVPMSLLLGLTLVAGWLSWWEAQVLVGLHSSDPVNTLRISNQALSVVMVLMLVKLKRQSWPGFVDARREMFGVYLAHTIVLLTLLRAARFSLRGAHDSWVLRTGAGMTMVWVVTTVVVFGVCLGIAKALARWPATGWLVGTVGDDAVAKKRPRLGGFSEGGENVGGVGTDAVVGVGFGVKDRS